MNTDIVARAGAPGFARQQHRLHRVAPDDGREEQVEEHAGEIKAQRAAGRPSSGWTGPSRIRHFSADNVWPAT